MGFKNREKMGFKNNKNMRFKNHKNMRFKNNKKMWRFKNRENMRFKNRKVYLGFIKTYLADYVIGFGKLPNYKIISSSENRILVRY